MRHPMLPVSEAVVNIPRAAVTLRSTSTRGTGVHIQNPGVLSMASFLCDVTGSIEANH